MGVRISVLLPVYNGERFLKEAIQSVVDQSFRDFELLVLDDGSTDATPDIIRGFSDPRVRHIRNEKNLKLIATLNQGVALAQGEFIARIDADDACATDRFLTQIEFLDAHPDVGACGSWAVEIDEDGIRGRTIRRPTGKWLRSWVWKPTPIIHPTVMARTAVLKKNPYRAEALHCEDYDLWIRLSKAGVRLENISVPLLFYRIHPGSISGENTKLQLEVSHRVFLENYPKIRIDFETYCSLIGQSPALSWTKRKALLSKLRKENRPKEKIADVLYYGAEFLRHLRANFRKPY